MLAQQPPPMLLLPGDPLPELPVNPAFQLDSYGGTWVLLLSCASPRLDELPTLTTGLFGQRSCTIVVLVRDVGPAALPISVSAPQGTRQASPQCFADPDSRAADALGALLGPTGRADVAALLDPRGRLQFTAVWLDSAALVADVCAVLVGPPGR